MTDFFRASMMIPQAMFRVAASMTSAMMEFQLHLLRQQRAFYDQVHAERRMDDPHPPPDNPYAKKRKGGAHPTPCCGPDLQDHYGKRAHDVDVEHI